MPDYNYEHRIEAGLCLATYRSRPQKAVTCSDNYQREYRRLRSSETAGVKCRLCGWRCRRSTKLGPVLTAHKGNDKVLLDQSVECWQATNEIFRRKSTIGQPDRVEILDLA